MTTDAGSRRKTMRSPSYPGINLQEAIAKARAIYDKALTHESRISVVLGYMGYSPKSGPGSTALAALSKFGLVEASGSLQARTARITERGRRIILRPEDSPERKALLQEAALLPSIHQELYERYGTELPDDATLRDYLIVDRAFNPNAVDDFIDEYRETLTYAGLLGSDTLTDNDEEMDQEPEEVDPAMVSAPPKTHERAQAPVDTTDPTMRRFAIPIGDRDAVLQVPRGMTEDDWNLMMAVVQAMKPGILRKSRDDASGSEQEPNDD